MRGGPCTPCLLYIDSNQSKQEIRPPLSPSSVTLHILLRRFLPSDPSAPQVHHPTKTVVVLCASDAGEPDIRLTPGLVRLIRGPDSLVKATTPKESENFSSGMHTVTHSIHTSDAESFTFAARTCTVAGFILPKSNRARDSFNPPPEGPAG